MCSKNSLNFKFLYLKTFFVKISIEVLLCAQDRVGRRESVREST